MPHQVRTPIGQGREPRAGLPMMHDDWAARIADGLANMPLNGMRLYAGDDRLRLARQQEAGRLRKAGVLIPIIADVAPRIVLTERSRDLRSHPGQISFPGGSVEPGDADVQAAAIREAHEEIGLAPEAVQVIGRLPDYMTGTGYDIAPIVARLPQVTRFAPDDLEVARVFTLPLARALDLSNYRRDTIAINGVNRQFHVIEYEGNYIWGATAAMLYGLCKSLHDSTPE